MINRLSKLTKEVFVDILRFFDPIFAREFRRILSLIAWLVLSRTKTVIICYHIRILYVNTMSLQNNSCCDIIEMKIIRGVFVMQIVIHLANKNGLRLPLDYGYRVSSAVYRLASADEEYSAFLHDCGYGRDGHRYKLFTYSPLRGRYCIENKHIIFDGDITLEVRSISGRFCEALKSSLLTKGSVKIMDTVLPVKMTEVYDRPLTVAEADIETVSPIVVSSSEDGKTIYYSPEDECWEQMINLTLYRKFTAAYNEEPPSVVKLDLLRKPKKVVTRVKGIWVTAYHAQLHITAHPLVTAFLYETGLGAKNSQGFGMFEEITK